METEKAKKFKEKHSKCRKKKAEKLFEYIIEIGGIGNVTKIKCPYCKKVEDITDYDCW